MGGDIGGKDCARPRLGDRLGAVQKEGTAHMDKRLASDKQIAYIEV
jgi:hypothetical protein